VPVVPTRQCNDLIASVEEISIGRDEERPGSLVCQGREGRINFSLSAGIQNTDPPAKHARGGVQVSRLDFSIRIGRIDERGNQRGCGNQLHDHFQTFCDQFSGAPSDARDIATWPVQAGDETQFDRIATDREHDGNRDRRCLGRECRGGTDRRDNRAHLTTHQIGRHRRQAIILTFRPAIFDCDVLSFDVAGVFQALAKCARGDRIPIGRCAVEEPDHRHRRLLSARRKRPRSRAA
jgi:hypothetical protein